MSSFSTKPPKSCDLVDDIGDDIFMHLSQKPIDPYIAIVALRGVPDQSIGPHQAVEIVAVSSTGRHPFGVID